MQSSQQSIADLSYLKVVTGDSTAMMEVFISSYIKTAPSCISEIEKSLATKNWQQLKKAAHTFKPQVNYMGLTEIMPLMQEVEDSAAEEKNLEGIDKKVARIKAVGTAAIKELEIVLNQLRKNNSQP